MMSSPIITKANRYSNYVLPGFVADIGGRLGFWQLR